MIEERLLRAGYQLMMAMDRAVDSSMPEDLSAIIKTHAKVGAVAALGTAWLPGAGGVVANLAAMGTIWTMYARINDRIGLPFSRNKVRSLASGVAVNMAAYFVASTVFSTAFSMFPGMGTFGASSLMTGLAYVLTMASGFVYIKILTRIFSLGVDPTSLSVDQLKEAMQFVFDHEDVKAVVKDAKQAFKSSVSRGEIKKDETVKEES
jgi:hypothetical protein